MDQPSVLIISDDPAFSRAVISRWRGEAAVPAFTMLGSDARDVLDSGTFDLALVGGVKSGALPATLRALSGTGKATLIVVDDNALVAITKQEVPRSVVLQRIEGWNEALVTVGAEMLARVEAVRKMQTAEAERAALEREAALGRYVLEMRHSLNNALTSILGNSELLLLDAGELSPPMISQLGTIRNMALRIHETVQRFSSLEKEMSFIERQATSDLALRQSAAACD